MTPALWITTRPCRTSGRSLRRLRPCYSASSGTEVGAAAARARSAPQHNYAVVGYLSQLSAHPLRSFHSRCSDDACVANNVNMKNYTTRHVDAHCQCPMVEVPMDKLRSTVKSGGVPLIAVREDGSEHMELEVAEMREQPYIAFSHVWSDGLGNPNANALPQCQLRRLASYTQEIALPTTQTDGLFSCFAFTGWDVPRLTSITATKWFWIDTFCIPATDEDLKYKAINRMAAVYACARQVLVLDSSMERFAAAETDPCELFARITLMAWMNRSWTFQEGALATNCHIQLADKSLDPLMVRLESEPNILVRLFMSRSHLQSRGA